MQVDFFHAVVPPPPRAGSYATIMADPPWLERGAGQIRRGADRHYPLMNTPDICDLPVSTWAAPDAHLYLWVTNNFLEHGLVVMAAWCFRYVTMVTWIKDRPGLGQYFRGMTEHCLFGVRGRVPYQVNDDGTRAQGRTVHFELPELPEAFEADRRAHSAKPEQFRRIVERVSVGPRLEMFARVAAPGWDAWGNEAPEAI